MEHLVRLHKYKNEYNFRELGYDFDLDVKCLLKIENPYNYMDFLRYRNLRIIYNEYRMIKADLIHAHFIRDGYYAYLLKKNHPEIKYIVTAQGSDITHTPYFSNRMKRITLDVLHNADKAIFVSDYLRQSAISYGYEDKISVIVNNGYDAVLFFPKHNNDEKKDLLIGYCGLLIPRKNVMIFPKVFKIIKQRFPSSKFVIMGQGNLKSKLIKLFKEEGILNSVRFTNEISHQHIAEEYRKMDVLLLPSLREGFPTVVAEVIGSNLQIVGSVNGGVKEAIGDCGISVPLGDKFEDRFADAVIHLLQNPIPLEKFKERKESLTWKALVDKEIEIYREVVGDIHKI